MRRKSSTLFEINTSMDPNRKMQKNTTCVWCQICWMMTIKKRTADLILRQSRVQSRTTLVQSAKSSSTDVYAMVWLINFQENDFQLRCLVVGISKCQIYSILDKQGTYALGRAKLLYDIEPPLMSCIRFLIIPPSFYSSQQHPSSPSPKAVLQRGALFDSFRHLL